MAAKSTLLYFSCGSCIVVDDDCRAVESTVECVSGAMLEMSFSTSRMNSALDTGLAAANVSAVLLLRETRRNFRAFHCTGWTMES